MISPIPYVTPTKPTYATLPFIGIQPALMDENGNELKGNQVEGRLCIKFPWPSIARTIWGNHQRYKETYFSAFDDKYFTGDGALRDEVGYYRIGGFKLGFWFAQQGSIYVFTILIFVYVRLMNKLDAKYNLES
jgi:acetyl-CoA synthetase